MSAEIGFIGLGALLVLLILRVPVMIALVVVSFCGIAAMLGVGPALGVLSGTPYDFAASWTLSAIPMFLFMGFLAFHGGLTGGLFEAAKAVLRRLPGGLAISSVFACSGFAAVSGSSLACAAAMGRIAIPEMIAAGYRPSLAAGCIAAGGTIGALIPPSILMIVYGVFAETSVTQVFLGGISVGILTAVGYSLVVVLICLLRPQLIPRHAAGIAGPGARQAILAVLPVLLLAAFIFGGMFSGLFTATEAGAMGALGTLVISFATRALTRDVFLRSLRETVTTTASLFLIGIGAAMFTRFLGLSGLSGVLSALVADSGLALWQTLFVIVLIYLALGTFMEPFGAMLVTLPIFLPILRAEGVSLVWFGVFVVKMLEIGMITPPVGMNVFVIRSVARAQVTLVQVFRGVVPFLLADLVVVALMVLFPTLVLLPVSLLN